jgi:hypothetical protein
MQPKALILPIMLKFHITKAGKNSMASYEISNQQEAGQQEAGNSPDLLIVGGRPSGSTISALPTEQGHDIVLGEKSHHPGFHIGESPEQEQSSYFDFGPSLDISFPHDCEVSRSRFEEILFKNALVSGARSRVGCGITGTGFRRMFFKQSMVVFKESCRAWLRRKRSIRVFAGELIAL